MKTKNGTIAFAALALFWVLLLTDRIPNPMDRFFEVGARLYYTMSRAVDASHSSQLRVMLKETLEKDGKLTMHNMRPIWPVYMASLPNGFVTNEGGEQDLATERRLLMARVGADLTAAK